MVLLPSAVRFSSKKISSDFGIIPFHLTGRRRKTGEKDRYQNGGRSKGENEPHFSEESLDNSEEDVDVRSRGSRGSRRKGKHKRRMSESHKEKYVTEEMRRGENRYESFERRGKGSRGHSKVHRQEAYTRKRADRKSRRQGHEEYSSEEGILQCSRIFGLCILSKNRFNIIMLDRQRLHYITNLCSFYVRVQL